MATLIRCGGCLLSWSSAFGGRWCEAPSSWGGRTAANRLRPPARRSLALAEIFRQRGIDMFAWPGAALVGRPLPSLEETGDALHGQWRVEKVFPTLEKDQPAARFSARIITREGTLAPDYVVVSQPDGTVIGLGRRTESGGEKRDRHRRLHSELFPAARLPMPRRDRRPDQARTFAPQPGRAGQSAVKRPRAGCFKLTPALAP